MKKSIFLSLAAIVMAAGCTQETIAPVNPATTTISVNLESVKTTLSDLDGTTRHILWKEGDKVKCNGVESNPLAAMYDGQASASFVFEGVLTPPYTITYPADYFDGSGNLSLPDVIESGIMPLKGTGSGSISLEAQAAMVKISILRNNEGDVDIDNVRYVDVTANGKTVRVNMNAETSTSDALEVFVPVPAGSSIVSVRVVDINGHFMDKETSSAKVLSNGNITALREFKFIPTGILIDIATKADWETFAAGINGGSIAKTAEVTVSSDIDFESGAPTSVQDFQGKFNGNEHTFSGISATNPLFSAPTNATIENLTIEGAFEFTASGSELFYAAPLAGYANTCTITNVTNNAPVSVSGSLENNIYVGGIVAQNHNGTVSSCTNKGTVTIPDTFSTTGDIYQGGIYGAQSGSNSLADEVKNTGDITCKASATNHYIGGVFGSAANGKLSTKVNRNQSSITVTGVTNLCCGGLYGTIQKASGIQHPKATPYSEAGKTLTVSKIANGGTIAVGGLIGRTVVAFNFEGTGVVSMARGIYVYADDKDITSGTIAVGGFIGLAKDALTVGGEGGLNFGGNVVVHTGGTYKFYPGYCGMGGIIGLAQKGVNISNCVSTGEGKIGNSDNTTKQNSTSKLGAGGIVGVAYGGTSSITGCQVDIATIQTKIFNNQTISAGGGPCAGGIIGQFALNDANTIAISNCTVDGSYIWSYRGYGGGIAGYIYPSSTISSCIAKNVQVTGNANAQAFAAVLGATDTGTTVTNCGISGSIGSTPATITGANIEACPIANIASGTYLYSVAP